MSKIFNITEKGFGLIEIIVVVSIGIITFLSIENFLNFSLRTAKDDTAQMEAVFLARASLEQARSVRDENWTNLSSLTLGSNYSFAENALSPVGWMTQSGSVAVGKYTVWFNLSSVQRDASSDIVTSGGTVDPNTLKVDSYVSWPSSGGTKQISLTEYLTNFK